MGHTLKKYLSNRGSALFMVLSTMTALMICCMAMYFSIVSSRSTQYAVFNQQQAYQSAASLSDAIIASMYNKTGEFAKIADKIKDLKVGEYITTNSNGFAAFDPAGTGDPEKDQFGAYMMTIKRLEDETVGGEQVKVFDIVITTSVNGTKEAVHNVIQFKETPGGKALPGPMNVFTATGYVPNDVFLEGGTILTDVYFDNQQTIVNAFGDEQMELNGNLSCGGSITFNKYIICTADVPVTYAIRGNFTNNFNSPLTLKAINTDSIDEKVKNMGRSTVMIGGDVRGRYTFANSNVYILGDLILDDENTQYSILDKSSKFFVAGNIVLKSGEYDPSNVYCNGIVDTSENDDGFFTVGKTIGGTWTEAATGIKGEDANGLMTKDEMIEALDAKTATGTYYKWKVSETGMVTDPKTIHFVPVNNDTYIYPLPTPGVTRYIEYGSEADGKGCIIEDITMRYLGASPYNTLTLVVDTGDNPDNVYTIKLKGNRNYIPDAENTKETFCWFPKNTGVKIKKCVYYKAPEPGCEDQYELTNVWAQLDDGSWGFGYRKILGLDYDGNKIYEYESEIDSSREGKSSCSANGGSIYFQVLVMGRGSVLIDIPEGVTYQDDEFLQVMHYGWYSLHGGQETYFGDPNKEGKSKKYLVEHTAFSHFTNNGNEETLFSSFIHYGCHDGDGCTYTEETTTEECPVCKKKTYNIVCGKHGVVDTYCKECQPNRGKGSGKCSNRIDKESIDKHVADDADFYTKHAFMKGKDGKIIYPNVNIFLISCDENAKIRLSAKAAPSVSGETTEIKENGFFGYIYAPYMTFKAGPGQSGGGRVRLMGGLTVSDYIISDSYSMLACWPDKVPEKLMDKSSFDDELGSLASKSWKISLVGR